MLYPLYSSPDIARNVLEPIGTQKRSGVDTVWPSLKLVDWALPRKARFDVPLKSKHVFFFSSAWASQNWRMIWIQCRCETEESSVLVDLSWVMNNLLVSRKKHQQGFKLSVAAHCQPLKQSSTAGCQATRTGPLGHQMAAFVQSYGLQLLDRSGKDFDAPRTQIAIGCSGLVWIEGHGGIWYIYIYIVSDPTIGSDICSDASVVSPEGCRAHWIPFAPQALPKSDGCSTSYQEKSSATTRLWLSPKAHPAPPRLTTAKRTAHGMVGTSLWTLGDYGI